MLPDPPQKLGFNALKNKDRAFVDWNSFKDYTDKLSSLNDYLERKDALARQLKYKEELDALLRFKASQENEEKQRQSEEHTANQAEVQRAVEAEQRLQEELGRFERKRLEDCERDMREREAAVCQQKQKDSEHRAKELEENQRIMALTEQQRRERKAEVIHELESHMQQQLSAKEELKKQQKLDDLKFFAAEQELLKKQEERNKDFLEKIRNFKLKNEKAVEMYQKIHEQDQQKRKLNDYNTIEKPFLEKMKLDLEKEEKELKSRQFLNKEKNEFVLRQIEHNRIKKQLLNFEEALLDNEKLQRDLEAKNIQDQQFKANYKAKLADNLRALKDQIDANRKALLDTGKMNQAEADINNHSTVRVDYIRPHQDIISGFPGLGISHDRRAQLDVLDKNLAQNDRQIEQQTAAVTAQQNRCNLSGPAALSKLLRDPAGTEAIKQDKYKKMPYEQRLSHLAETVQRAQQEKHAKSEPAKENCPSFKSEYDAIRHKNKFNNFNIISNQINNNF